MSGRQEVGGIHMVAVVPAERGRKPGRAVVLAALNKLHREGMSSAELLTDDHRLPAIKTYLGVGFEPRIGHESHLSKWDAVYA